MLFQKAKALPTATRGSPEHLDRSGQPQIKSSRDTHFPRGEKI